MAIQPSIKIRTKTHLLKFSTMSHVAKNEIKFILFNERPCDISLVLIM